eukprot:4134205-Pleurochrysis_carterae.AAC.1
MAPEALSSADSASKDAAAGCFVSSAAELGACAAAAASLSVSPILIRPIVARPEISTPLQKHESRYLNIGVHVIL